MKAIFLKNSKYSILIFIFSAIFASCLFTDFVSAAKFDINNFKNTSGLDKTAQGSGYVIQSNPDPGQTLTNTIKIFLTFLGVIFLALMMYAGFTWMLAKGNQQKIEKAKNIITNSIIGLVVIMAAYGITMLVATSFFAQE